MKQDPNVISYENKILIGLVIAIIIMLVGGFFLLSPNHEKTRTKITITSNSTLHENEKISIRLTDVNDTPLSNENVIIRVVKENGESNNYKTNTDSSGNASLDLKDFTSGKYIVRVKYGGNDNYAGCNTTQKIEII